MSDGDRRGKHPGQTPQDLKGAEPDPFAPLPRRSHARRHIATPPLPPPPGPPHARRLSKGERDALQERHSGRLYPPTTPRRPSRQVPQTRPHRRWTSLVVVALLAVLIAALGSSRLFGRSDPPSPTAAPVAVASPSRDAVAALPPIATTGPVATATPTAPPTATQTPSPTPLPTATPTPDPKYRGRVICLDPGHGGWDRGFSRTADDAAPAMEEQTYNLRFALALRDRLTARGFRVVMTRTSDVAVNAGGGDVNGDSLTYDYWKTRDPAKAARVRQIDELQARINICNAASAELLVSLHINGYDDPNADGFETWWSSSRPFGDSSRRFAQLAFEELGTQTKAAGYAAHPRGVNDDKTADAPTGKGIFDHYVMIGPTQPGEITPSAMPGAIIEALFISNGADAAFLASDGGGSAIVTAYELAIKRYFDILIG